MRSLLGGVIMLVLLSSCSSEPNLLGNTAGNNPANQGNSLWIIPKDEVFDGGPGKDGIPALENPEIITAEEAGFMLDQEFVLGYFDGENAVAYPHQILDWHEIINDELNFVPYAIVYCPLTGTGIGWDRTLRGSPTTFGVSGLLYNNNLIPYDRQTGSNWSQMRLDCVNGPLVNTKIKTFQLVETRWAFWKEMYPDTKVVSLNTGWNRSYGVYPYGDYKVNEDNLLFPISIDDRRLNRKERVHGIIVEQEAKVYRFSSFPIKNTLITDTVNGKDVLVIGNEPKNFIVSFYGQLEDGSTPEFSAVDDGNIILVDNLGNKWDIFGYAVSGPAMGERLIRTESFIGYWFSWGVFYPDSEIYDF
jgi:uncharacterized protein DUF3179